MKYKRKTEKNIEERKEIIILKVKHLKRFIPFTVNY